MKKISLLLGSVVLALGMIAGCSQEPCPECEECEECEVCQQCPECPTPLALPDARLPGVTENKYNTANSGVQITPAAESGAKKLSDYLDREDVIYIDARDFGSYLKGHIEGFECLPYFDIIFGTGSQLFYKEEGVMKARYENSVATLKTLVPEGRAIFLMCQSGGRIVGFMDVLEFAGYDMSKVYNVGGWGTVGSDADYKVSKGTVGASATFDFSGVDPVAA